MIITVQHAKIMTMLYTCAGLIGKPQTTKVNMARGVHRYVSTVEALNTAHPTAVGALGTIGNNQMVHPNPWGKTNRSIPKFQKTPWVEQPLWVPTHRDTHLSPNLKGPTLDMIANIHNTTEITIMITGSHRGSLMQSLMRDTTRDTHFLHPTNTFIKQFIPRGTKQIIIADCWEPIKDNRGDENKSGSTGSNPQRDD